eukprot:TRINITY_DN7961_c0_g1_i2.p1 TRINITY_DN7961_c0_g1~~TRINITY_DN7961_c0_g1_i2.p1  ORF type:complete len:162 (+),score=13.14 TRINITY_DN7961_c0_g1_i2:377-862(+)
MKMVELDMPQIATLLLRCTQVNLPYQMLSTPIVQPYVEGLPCLLWDPGTKITVVFIRIFVVRGVVKRLDDHLLEKSFPFRIRKTIGGGIVCNSTDATQAETYFGGGLCGRTTKVFCRSLERLSRVLILRRREGLPYSQAEKFPPVRAGKTINGKVRGLPWT